MEVLAAALTTKPVVDAKARGQAGFLVIKSCEILKLIVRFADIDYLFPLTCERRLSGVDFANRYARFVSIAVGVRVPNASLLTTFRQSTVSADLSLIEGSETPC